MDRCYFPAKGLREEVMEDHVLVMVFHGSVTPGPYNRSLKLFRRDCSTAAPKLVAHRRDNSIDRSHSTQLIVDMDLEAWEALMWVSARPLPCPCFRPNHGSWEVRIEEQEPAGC